MPLFPAPRRPLHTPDLCGPRLSRLAQSTSCPGVAFAVACRRVEQRAGTAPHDDAVAESHESELSPDAASARRTGSLRGFGHRTALQTSAQPGASLTECLLEPLQLVTTEQCEGVGSVKAPIGGPSVRLRSGAGTLYRSEGESPRNLSLEHSQPVSSGDRRTCLSSPAEQRPPLGGAQARGQPVRVPDTHLQGRGRVRRLEPGERIQRRDLPVPGVFALGVGATPAVRPVLYAMRSDSTASWS